MPDQQGRHREAQKILERARRLLAAPADRQQSGESNGWQETEKGIAILFAHIQTPGLQGDAAMSNGSQALAQYKAVVIQQVLAHGGHLLAEAADTVLALFCRGQQATPAEASVGSAATIMERVAAMNKQRLAQDLVPYRIGIGIDSGTVGTGAQVEAGMAGTALERHVRLARGLSDLNQQTPFPAIFISENVAAGLDDRNGYHIQNLGDVFINKQQQPVTVYALLHSNQSRAT